jgi:serine/threonine-protein kinase 24/25/MST4
MYQATVRQSGAWGDSLRSDWAFETVTASAMGTFRTAARDIMPPGMIPDEEEDEGGHQEDLSMAAIHGSDVTVQPPHSTVNLRAFAADEAPPADEPVASAAALGQGPPPAYNAASLRGARRSSYGQRTSQDGRGTSLREADLGTGVDTIRPVKKVDKEGSLRLSSDFVGSLRQRPDELDAPASPAAPSPVAASPKSSASKRPASETSKAGAAMVDEIVLPLLQKSIRDDMEAREIEGLSMLSRGFEELRDANPTLAYNLILDMLTGINE